MGLQHMCGSISLRGMSFDLGKYTHILGPAAGVILLIALYKFLLWRNKRDIRDKVVLITGASSGIGKSCAFAFYKAGCKVILSSRTEANLNKVKDELKQSGSGHEPYVQTIDMSDYDSIRQAAHSVLDKYGHVDILVNNAGQGFRGAIINTTLSSHEQIMKVNYFGQVLLTQELLPSMISHGGGDIVAVSSVQGKLYVPYRAAYGAAKHALECYCDVLRAEHYYDNIRVCVCSPGYVRTSLPYQALTGDGTHFGKTDDDIKNGMSPDYIADGILDGVQYGTKHMILAPFLPKLACYLRLPAWNLIALIMRIRAKHDKFRPKKTQ